MDEPGCQTGSHGRGQRDVAVTQYQMSVAEVRESQVSDLFTGQSVEGNRESDHLVRGVQLPPG